VNAVELSVRDVRERLAAHAARRMDIEGFRRAAVLVPLLERPDGLQMLLTVRSPELRSHGGQIAFPGGRLEAGEDDVEAALRETLEEVGVVVRPEQVVGRLSDHPSPAGYVATPVVAVLPWVTEFTPDPSEVAEAFTVPLADLALIEPTSRIGELQKYRRRIYSYRWRDRDIWGFTGNVVRDLLMALYEPDVADGAKDPYEP
jgi:8-oxo-dGTP pyrophosphatase MutT (NUDIX family)